jgi:hypothetical protein
MPVQMIMQLAGDKYLEINQCDGFINISAEESISMTAQYTFHGWLDQPNHHALTKAIQKGIQKQPFYVAGCHGLTWVHPTIFISFMDWSHSNTTCAYKDWLIYTYISPHAFIQRCKANTSPTNDSEHMKLITPSHTVIRLEKNSHNDTVGLEVKVMMRSMRGMGEVISSYGSCNCLVTNNSVMAVGWMEDWKETLGVAIASNLELGRKCVGVALIDDRTHDRDVLERTFKALNMFVLFRSLGGMDERDISERGE